MRCERHHPASNPIPPCEGCDILVEERRGEERRGEGRRKSCRSKKQGKPGLEGARRRLDSLNDADAGHGHGQAQAAPGVPSLERQQRESDSLHHHPSPSPSRSLGTCRNRSSSSFLLSWVLKGRAFLGFGFSPSCPDCLLCQLLLDFSLASGLTVWLRRLRERGFFGG